MENKSFTSQYSNVCNEALYRIVPNPYGLNNVTGTQIQNRNIYDSTTMSVHPNLANPQQQRLASQGQQCVNCPAAVQIRTMQEQIPGGVTDQRIYNAPNPNPFQQTYTYNPGPQAIQQCSNPQMYCPNKPCMTNQQTQNQTQLNCCERGNMETMMVEELKQSPYQLKFHYNGQTSTSDLLTGQNQIQPSMGTPDYNNLAGIINNLRNSIETEFPIVVHQTTKVFLLTKSPDIQQTSEGIRNQDKSTENDCDVIDKELQTEKQRVSFEDTEEEPPTKSKKKKRKGRKKGRRSSKTKCKDSAKSNESTSSISSADNDDDYDDEEYTEDEDNL